MAVFYVSASGAQVTNTLEGRQAMENARLTRRGKIVLGIAIAVIVYWLFDITTPEQCKVPLEEMSQWCKDFRYP